MSSLSVTDIARWIAGHKRETILKQILQDTMYHKAQLLGTEFHSLIANLLHEEYIERLYHEFGNYNGIMSRKSEAIKFIQSESLSLINNDIVYLSFDADDYQHLQSSSSYALLIFLNIMFENGYDLEDLAFDPPYITEELIEGKIAGVDVIGRLDLRYYFDDPVIIDWKFKQDWQKVRIYSNYRYQLNLYEQLIELNEGISSRLEIYWGTPEKCWNDPVQKLVNFEFDDHLIELKQVFENLEEPVLVATNQFEAKWYTRIEKISNVIVGLPEQSRPAVLKNMIEVILEQIEIDKKLLEIDECRPCFRTCIYYKICSH